MAGQGTDTARVIFRLLPVAPMLFASMACKENDVRRVDSVAIEEKDRASLTAPQPIYVAVLARSREAYQEPRVDGVLDVRDDCAMLGDNLLVLVAGSSLTGTGHGWALQTAGVEPRRVAPGDRIMAGGAVFPVENLDRVDTDLVLAKPVPARCKAVARGAALAAPIERIMPAGTSR